MRAPPRGARAACAGGRARARAPSARSATGRITCSSRCEARRCNAMLPIHGGPCAPPPPRGSPGGRGTGTCPPPTAPPRGLRPQQRTRTRPRATPGMEGAPPPRPGVRRAWRARGVRGTPGGSGCSARAAAGTPSQTPAPTTPPCPPPPTQAARSCRCRGARARNVGARPGGTEGDRRLGGRARRAPPRECAPPGTRTTGCADSSPGPQTTSASPIAVGAEPPTEGPWQGPPACTGARTRATAHQCGLSPPPPLRGAPPLRRALRRSCAGRARTRWRP
mmetsp:Transcript_35785/g.113039  ORF Transcript_35785/g.113039 Transcript_35785/m.113039 type:complete len:278 (+) Transcript_35785:722-1555(+)